MSASEKSLNLIDNSCASDKVHNSDFENDAEKMIITNRRALSADRNTQQKLSIRQKKRQADLKADRDFRHNSKKIDAKARPDKKMLITPTINSTDMQSAHAKISELEDVIRSLRSEISNLLAPPSRMQQKVEADVHRMLNDDSFSDDEIDNNTTNPNQHYTQTAPHTSDGFTIVNRKGRSPTKTPTNIIAPIPIATNIYSILPCPIKPIRDETNIQANHKSQSMSPKSAIPTQPPTTKITTATITSAKNMKKQKRPPPIITYGMDAKVANENLPLKLGHNNFTLKKVNANCTHLQTESADDHAMAREALKMTNIAHHTYTLHGQRLANIVLRNLCCSYNKDDVEEAIKNLNLNIEISHISQFATEKSRREKSQLRMWLVQLKPQSDVASLLKTTKLLNQIVRFEHRQSKGISQCRNCQHFGHSANNCSRPFRCVKCTNQHLPGQCPITEMRQNNEIEIKPRCVNCQGEHPANYRGCLSYLNYINIKAQRTDSVREQNEIRRTAYNNIRQPNITYADATTNRTQQRTPTQQATQPATQPSSQYQPPSTHEKNNNALDLLENECNIHFGINLTTLLTKASQFIPYYVSLPNENKPMALIKFALSIAPTST